jgi:hypothetical protein
VLLKGYSKNTSYRHPYGVGVKLPTIATGYATYRFAKKKKDREAHPFLSPCAFLLPRAPPPPVNPRPALQGDITGGLLSQAKGIPNKMISLPMGSAGAAGGDRA